MPSALTIRRATPADARSIAELHVHSWQWAYRGLLPDAFLLNKQTSPAEALWRTSEVEGIVGEVVASMDLDV